MYELILIRQDKSKVYFCAKTIYDVIQDAKQYALKYNIEPCDAEINGTEITYSNGEFYDQELDKVCVNPKWHEIFASSSLKIKPIEMGAL